MKYSIVSILVMFMFNLSADEQMVAKVIYSEASAKCSPEERYLVASVIKNRLANRDFGSKKTLTAVVLAPKQFSCVNDDENSNWKQSGNHLKSLKVRKNIRYAWMQAMNLAKGEFNAFPEVVYYHDKSLSNPPKNWTKIKKVILVKETEHFKFYKVEDV